MDSRAIRSRVVPFDGNARRDRGSTCRCRLSWTLKEICQTGDGNGDERAKHDVASTFRK